MKLNPEEKALTKIDNNIFHKIKKFFKKFFTNNNKEINNCEENKVSALDKKKEDFNKTIKIDMNNSLMNLYLQLKDEKIEVDDLSDEEIESLINFYKEQIAIKRKRKRDIEIKLEKTGIKIDN